MKPLPYRRALEMLAERERGEGWLPWCERAGVYQLPVVEWLDALAEAIGALAPARPLEVGAGEGTIGLALRARGVPLRLTDPAGRPPVERLDAAGALERYRPDLLLSSWLPFDSGAEAAVLAAPCVRWYLAVVQTGPGFAGGEGLWRAPGWGRRPLPGVDRWSVSRMDFLTDVDRGEHVRHGAAFLFTREG